MNRIDNLVPDVDWRRPEDVSERLIDPESGMLATPYCPETRGEIFVAGTEPQSVCPLHAGSGDPSPFWPEPQIYGNQPQPPLDPDEAKRRAEQERRRARERDGSIRKLLRKIFGDG
jgi:hypothetical protein